VERARTTSDANERAEGADERANNIMRCTNDPLPHSPLFAEKVQFSNADVYMYIGTAVLCDVFLHILSIVFQPAAPGYVTECLVRDEDGLCIKSYEELQCIRPTEVWRAPIVSVDIFFFVSIIAKVGLTCFGLYLAWKTKRFDQQ
jgi:hypothetical protein